MPLVTNSYLLHDALPPGLPAGVPVRFFYMIMTAPLAGADAYANLGKIEFYKWGSKVAESAWSNVAATYADEYFSGRGPEHLFNDNPVSAGQWTSNGNPYPHMVGVQFTTPIEFDTVVVTPSTESPHVRSPKDFNFRISNVGFDSAVQVFAKSGETLWNTPHTYKVFDWGLAPGAGLAFDPNFDFTETGYSFDLDNLDFDFVS